MFKIMNQPGLGSFPVPASPVTFGNVAQTMQPWPILGQHTEEILSNVVGADDREIAQLFDKGIVARKRLSLAHYWVKLIWGTFR